jgi:hypothetical protein
MTRSRLVQRRALEQQASERLKAECPEYRTAAEALRVAADLGCSGDIYDALYDLMRQTGEQYEAKVRLTRGDA